MRSGLEALQQTFANALLDVEEVEPALATFKGNSDLNRERFAFYRGNVIAIWQQTCANAFPVLKQLVGAEFFNGLSRAYGLTYASQSGNLTEFGASLPIYLRTLENCRADPYLGDIAALEWQVHCAYYLEYRAPVTLAHLAAVEPEQLAELHFKLQPSCFLLQSPWAVADIWQAHQDTDIVYPKQLSNPNYCLIWRQPGNWNVQVNSISAASYRALQALARGDTLDQAVELALAEDPGFELQTELADWFNKQIFCEINLHA